MAWPPMNMSEDPATRLARTANSIALAAATLAAGAFFIALLQAILEYVSSGDARHKCNVAAIGPSAAYTKHRWSLRSWKFKSYYPELKFGLNDILAAAYSNERNGIQCSLTLDIETNDTIRTGWRAIRSKEVLKRGDVRYAEVGIAEREAELITVVMDSQSYPSQPWGIFQLIPQS